MGAEQRAQRVREEHRAEVEKERNIATIMVEDVNEEMERRDRECEAKMERQRTQIRELRAVAEDAVSVGQRALSNHSAEKDAEIERLRGEVREKERVQERYARMRQSKLALEQKVLHLTQQVIETFASR